MQHKRTLQIIIAVLIVAILGATTIFIPYLISQRQFQPTQAWRVQVSANAACVDNQSKIGVSFTNTEPVSDRLAMKVTATDLQTNQSVDLGTVASGQTATGVIVTNSLVLNSGEVRFNMSWADGREGTDTRTAHYQSVNCSQSEPTPTHPAGIRISHMDCTEILAVLPDAPEELEDTEGECLVTKPGGGSIAVTMNWSRYDGPVAKWVALKNQYYANAGNYTITDCTMPVREVENLPFSADLNCAVASPTPTSGPSATPTATSTPSLTPTPPPPSCELTVHPRHRPSATPTPTITPTSTPGPSATPTLTSTPTLTTTPMPSSTITPTNNPTATPTNLPTITPTPGTFGCGYTPCTDNNSCLGDLSCVLATNGVKYCAELDKLDACIANPSDANCCHQEMQPTSTPKPSNTPTTPPASPTRSPTPTPLIVAEQPELPQVGTSWPTLVLSMVGFFILAGGLLMFL